jgi:hypothetical protein
MLFAVLDARDELDGAWAREYEERGITIRMLETGPHRVYSRSLAVSYGFKAHCSRLSRISSSLTIKGVWRMARFVYAI